MSKVKVTLSTDDPDDEPIEIELEEETINYLELAAVERGITLGELFSEILENRPPSGRRF